LKDPLKREIILACREMYRQNANLLISVGFKESYSPNSAAYSLIVYAEYLNFAG
jgi:hypothetical protein